MTSSTVLNIKMDTDWKQILDNLPNDANQPMVSEQFVQPILAALGFNKQEYCPEFPTGKGKEKVDYAARKNQNIDIDIFNITKANPYLLIEVKAKTINLGDESPKYKQAKAQITEYLLSPKCKTAEWGIITNGDFIQLFRRHGKVVFPATENYIIKPSNIAEIVAQFKNLINNPPRALSIAIYNDKGGVGKTTTIANLASILASLRKNVLVIDFDPQQADLTDSLGIKEGTVKLSDCLINHNLNIKDTIQPFDVPLKGRRVRAFDIIPCDSGLAKIIKSEGIDGTILDRVQGNFARLRRLIEPLLWKYDYIIFDCPTNWGFYSQSCVYAADAVLIPTQHDNFASLKNAKKVIKEYVPQMQQKRKEKSEYGIPIALPIFFNNHKSTDASMKTTHKEIDSILIIDHKVGNIDKDLIPFFFPKATPGNFDRYVFNVPQYAIIAKAGFSRIPAALVHKTANTYYNALAKEYFIHE